MISWEAIATACSDLLQKVPRYAEKGIYYDKRNLNAVGKTFLADSHDSNGPITHIQEHLYSNCSSPSHIEKAIGSVCLITMDDGVWASGVFLNRQGLILTNAHLLVKEPQVMESMDPILRHCLMDLYHQGIVNYMANKRVKVFCQGFAIMQISLWVMNMEDIN